MKKTTQCLAMMVAIFFAATTLSSCNKKKEVLEPISSNSLVEKVNANSTYTIGITMNDHDVLPYVMGQSQNPNMPTVSAHIEIDSAGSSGGLSMLFIDNDNSYVSGPRLAVTKAGTDALAIMFKGTNPMWVSSDWNDLPQALQVLNVFAWFDNGGQNKYVGFANAQLSQVYAIEEVKVADQVTGFVLTAVDGNRIIKITLSIPK